MPPGGGEGDEHGCTVQEHPPATVRRDQDALPHSTPLLPAIAPVPSQEKKQKRQEEKQHPAASLPEGPLVEILARVPYRSLCRFKCVSKPWLALCSSPDIRKRSPQTLSGFFYYEISYSHNFRNLSGRGAPLVDPSLPFLRESYGHNILLIRVCGGLLLCSCWKPGRRDIGPTEYVVCNPATREWTVLPPMLYPGEVLARLWDDYLGFDATVPSRFVVFTSLTNYGRDSGKMAIYSSETGQWSYMHTKWDSGTPVDLDHLTENTVVFRNGIMHWPTARNSIVTVDSEGKVWREIKMPDDLRNSSAGSVSIGWSQGSLYAWRIDPLDTQLYIWVLEDYGAGKWILKHTVNVLEPFGRHVGEDEYSYAMFAVHPDCNVIFLTDGENMTVSYNLDNHKIDVICNEFMRGQPYIPCFAELPSAGH